MLKWGMPEPKEYLDGWIEFLGSHIDLSKHPLIPRPETEFWTEKIVKIIGNENVSVLDIFSGSGCIGVSLGKRCPNARVTLADKTNYLTTPLSKNCKFVLSNLFTNLEGKYDYILANPPYIPEGKGTAGIMGHEPKEALYAGKDGLSVILPFLEQARSHLNEHGQIWMEFGEGQKGGITDLLRTFGYYKNFACSFHRDQYSKWRYLICKSG